MRLSSLKLSVARLRPRPQLVSPLLLRCVRLLRLAPRPCQLARLPQPLAPLLHQLWRLRPKQHADQQIHPSLGHELRDRSGALTSWQAQSQGVGCPLLLRLRHSAPRGQSPATHNSEWRQRYRTTNSCSANNGSSAQLHLISGLNFTLHSAGCAYTKCCAMPHGDGIQRRTVMRASAQDSMRT